MGQFWTLISSTRQSSTYSWAPDNNYARINGYTWEIKLHRGIYTQYFGYQTSLNALSIVPLKKVTRNEPKVDWPPEVLSDQRAEALDSKGWPTIQGKRKSEGSLTFQTADLTRHTFSYRHFPGVSFYQTSCIKNWLIIGLRFHL